VHIGHVQRDLEQRNGLRYYGHAGGSMRMRITQLLNSIPLSQTHLRLISFSCNATKASALMFSDCIVASGSACFVCPVVTTSHGERIVNGPGVEHWTGEG
jgi:hypothetical protein